MSTRKNREAATETADGAVLAAAVVDPALDPALDPGFDPELDLVPVGEPADAGVDAGDDADAQSEAQSDATSPDDTSPDGTSPDGTRRLQGKGKLVIGTVVALVVAAGAVWAAGAIGGDSETGLPESVADPAVVIGALQDGGIECGGAAVSGDVATCNATVAVRIFATPAEAEKWIAALLKDPHTNSAIGWVRNGNVVVAAPLNAAPDISAALGTGSQIY